MRRGASRLVLITVIILFVGGVAIGCARRAKVTEAPVPVPEPRARGEIGAPREAGAERAAPAARGPAGIREERVGPGVEAAAPRRERPAEERLRGVQPEAGAAPGAKEPAVLARLPEREVAAISPFKDIYFEFDRYDLKAESKKALEEIADWLRKSPATRVQIEGHTDERGTDEYNLALGERRARAAQVYLTSLGIGSERLSIITYGEMRPADPGHSEEAWTKNRRDHFLLTTR